jgi:hypothetical protein
MLQVIARTDDKDAHRPPKRLRVDLETDLETLRRRVHELERENERLMTLANPAAAATAADAEMVMGGAAATPRGHGLVGARIRWTHKADTIVARCDHYDAVGQRYELVDDAGQRRASLRLHGPGSSGFEVLAPPPSFGVHTLECGLCGDVPTRATDCCRKLLCGECLRSIELKRTEYRRSIALAPPHNPSTCPFCRSDGTPNEAPSSSSPSLSDQMSRLGLRPRTALQR